METILSIPDSPAILGSQAWEALPLVEPFLLGLHATGRGWTRSQGVLVTANLNGCVGWRCRLGSAHLWNTSDPVWVRILKLL